MVVVSGRRNIEAWSAKLEKHRSCNRFERSHLNRIPSLAIIIFDNVVQDTTDVDTHMRFLVWHMERSIRLMKPEVEKHVVFIHLEGFSLFNSPPMDETKRTILILSRHFCERLGNIVFYKVSKSHVVRDARLPAHVYFHLLHDHAYASMLALFRFRSHGRSCAPYSRRRTSLSSFAS